MSKKLPESIEVIRLARAEQALSGVIPVADMPRLCTSLADTQGEVYVELECGIDSEGLVFIKGQLQTELHLVCQRCLQTMSLVMGSDFVVSPVVNDSQAKNLPVYYEPALMDEDERLSLTGLIEDEIILQLPIIAMHDPQQCPVSLGAVNDIVEIVEEEKISPFAKLEALKQRGGN
ncbi:MAG: YceD family protein [Gammaproteobacteria bacterium]|nr:YceD family protein [Gammaproteobacteria bacterium]